MECLRCGQSNLPDSIFCDNCGWVLAQAAGSLPPGSTPAWPPVRRMWLVVANNGIHLPLSGKRQYFIGRADPAMHFWPDVDLTLHGGDSSGVSRQHAKITCQDGQVLFEDLNSSNGSFVDKVQAIPGQKLPLAHGAEIVLGRIKLVFNAVEVGSHAA